MGIRLGGWGECVEGCYGVVTLSRPEQIGNKLLRGVDPSRRSSGEGGGVFGATCGERISPGWIFIRDNSRFHVFSRNGVCEQSLFSVGNKEV